MIEEKDLPMDCLCTMREQCERCNIDYARSAADKKTTQRVTVRRGKRSSGLLGMVMRPSYEVVKEKKVVAVIAENRQGLWYWYGNGNNTAHSPKTFEECRAEAVKMAKEMDT